MKYLAAYLLLTVGGNTSPSAEDIKSVLSAVGIEADEERLSSLLKELEGKDINELIAEGSSKLSSVPSGGASAAPSGGAAAAASYVPLPTFVNVPFTNVPCSSDAPAAEAKAEEKEESDDDMGFGLFD
ncbi:60S acidic ribosomal protein P2 [Saitoella coloradoensis]